MYTNKYRLQSMQSSTNIRIQDKALKLILKFCLESTYIILVILSVIYIHYNTFINDRSSCRTYCSNSLDRFLAPGHMSRLWWMPWSLHLPFSGFAMWRSILFLNQNEWIQNYVITPQGPKRHMVTCASSSGISVESRSTVLTKASFSIAVEFHGVWLIMLDT